MRLVNRSQWPTPFLKVICGWIARREKLPKPYRFTLPAIRSRYTWSGRGGVFGQRSRIHRRFGCKMPFAVTDSRPGVCFGPFEVRSRVELLVFLLAHEAHHATEGNRDEYRGASGRIDRASMEYDCNLAGKKAVEAMRQEWLELRERIKSELKRDQQKLTVAKIRRVDPEPKLVKAQDALVLWQKKSKLAATKIKKYKARVRYYEGKVAAFKST